MTDEAKRREEMQEQQFERNQHGTNITQAHSQDRELQRKKAQYLEQLAETGMSEPGTRLLNNMLSRTFVLGNIDSADVHNIKWELHSMFLKIKAVFPPEESDVQGKLRAYYYDDPDQNISALTDKQEIILAQMLKGIMVYVSRSKGGFQQDQLVKQVSVSEVRNPDENDNDGLLAGLRS